MSNVRKDERKEGKLELDILARNLAVYTIQITKNQNVFPPEYGHITAMLVEQAMKINRYIWAANMEG